MLVLSRKVGEDVIIPEFDVVFTIIEVQGERVRVGIKAPLEMLVFRRELWERIQRRAAEMGDIDSRSATTGCESVRQGS